MTTLGHMLQKHLGKEKITWDEKFTPPGVFTRLGSIRLPFFLVNAPFLQGAKVIWKLKVSKKDIDLYFTSKPERITRKGLQSPPERREKVIHNNGNYFQDWRNYFVLIKKKRKNSLLNLIARKYTIILFSKKINILFN